jgi:hypothetical protein
MDGIGFTPSSVDSGKQGSTVGSFGKPKKQLVLATLRVVGALVFAGCDWPMLGSNAALTGS